MDISMNVDRNINTFSLADTHRHLVTVNRCQGHRGGSQVLARYHIKKQYINHKLLTQDAEVKINKLHMHECPHKHTNLKETTKDAILVFMISSTRENGVSPNPSFLLEWFLKP